MTLEQVLAQKRANAEAANDKLTSLKQQRKSILDKIERERRTVATVDEDAQFTDLTAQIEAADKAARAADVELATVQAEWTADQKAQRAAEETHPVPGAGSGVRRMYDEVARVGREERTYTKQKSDNGQASFFADSWRAHKFGDLAARGRVERHLQEATREGEFVERAVSTSGFAGLVVPQYAVEAAALVARASRPFANTLQSQELPDQGMTLFVPQGTTGVTAAEQSSEGTAVSNTDEVWANISVPVVTIAGQMDISRQSLERGFPGLDELVYKDLAAAYAAKLDSLIINGSGSAGQPLGVLNVSGIGAATAFGAAVTAANFQTKVAGQVNSILSNRFLPPTGLVVHPRRWSWMLGLSDSSGRPLVTPPSAGPYNAQGVYDNPAYGENAGSFMGLPVCVDANLPANVGTNSEDVVLLTRNSDILLWEDGDGLPRQLQFEQTTGGSLLVKLVVYGYTAFTAARYPKSIGKVGGLDATGGQGLIAPTF